MGCVFLTSAAGDVTTGACHWPTAPNISHQNCKYYK